MISEVLVLLKDQLNAYLKLGQDPTADTLEDQVVFIDGQHPDPFTFKVGAVTVLMINIEEENSLRAPNQYAQVLPNGTNQKVNPEIRLNLYVLFVARFTQYDESLRFLSQIIKFFQKNRVIDHQKAPGLSEDIDQLIVELVTLPFSEQNEVWNALRVAYHPSVLYKVKMLVFQDEEAETSTPLEEADLKTLP